MQHRGGCNPVTAAQRSAMCLQNLSERSQILYKITPTNATPTTSWEDIFPQTLGFSLHEKPLWTGTDKRPYCLSLMILTSLTGNASFLLPGKPPHLPGGNLHMQISVLFLLSSLFLHTWIQIINKSETLIMKRLKIRKYNTGKSSPAGIWGFKWILLFIWAMETAPTTF